LHKEDNGAVGYEKKCKKCGKALTTEEIVKGYQFEPEAIRDRVAGGC
jgi:DNA end-binding protein Ku